MKKGQKFYTLEDLDKAFDMGLETAGVVIEKSIGLPIEGQRLIR